LVKDEHEHDELVPKILGITVIKAINM